MPGEQIRVEGHGRAFFVPIPNLNINNSMISAAKAATVATGILCQSRTLICSMRV
jgi:hypothetical protein